MWSLRGCTRLPVGSGSLLLRLAQLIAAIGENLAKNHLSTGYTTTNYLECNDDFLVMAGPQRSKLVVIFTLLTPA